MKNLLTILLVGFLSVFFTEISIAGEKNFRNTKWGMSMGDVIFSENLEYRRDEIIPFKDGKGFLFGTRILGKDVTLQYDFVDNQLVGARYYLKGNYGHSHKILIYREFKDNLTKKYGTPSSDETIWGQGPYLWRRNDSDRWGMAIAEGHLVLSSSWETQGTDIRCRLRGVERGNVHLIVEYDSKHRKRLEKEAYEREARDAF